MNPSGGTLTALVGLLTLRLTLDGSFQRYVREGMRPWLLFAGAALLVLGLVTLVRALASGDDSDGPVETAHGHSHGVGVGWLLLVPMATLLLVAPPSLGSFGVDRSTPIRVTAGRTLLPPLDTSGGGPVAMTMLEYTERSFDHDGRSLRGASVELTGFVVGDEAGGFRIARYQIACCAADAAAAVVHVRGVVSPPPRDQWVTVTGSYTAGKDPTIAVTALREIQAPEDPYE